MKTLAALSDLMSSYIKQQSFDRGLPAQVRKVTELALQVLINVGY